MSRVERRAVNKFSDAIDECGTLEPYFGQNDKTPFTDGHVDIHCTEEIRNSTFVGRVGVQIKGRSVNNIPLSFSIDRETLDAFTKIHGVVYLVDFISKSNQKHYLRYCILNPFKIIKLINDHSRSTKTISVPLKRFPKDPEAICRIFTIALDAQAERIDSPFAEIPLHQMSGIKVSTTEKLDLQHPVIVNYGNNDYTIKALTADGNELPLNAELRIVPEDYTERPIGVPVRSGDTIYDSPTRAKIDNAKWVLKFDANLALTISVEDNETTAHLNYSPQGSFAKEWKALRFINNIMLTETLHFGERAVRISSTSHQSKLQDTQYFAMMSKLNELFEHLGVPTELIDLDTLNQHRIEQLQTIYSSVIDGEEVTQQVDSPARIRQPIGEWYVDLSLTPGSAPGRFIIESTFEPRRWMFAKECDDEQGKKRFARVTVYDLFGPEELSKILNPRFDYIVNAYSSIEDSPDLPIYANRTLLNLIHAADMAPARTDELLSAAERLSKWLIRTEGPTSIHRLNDWQLRARRGRLSEEDTRKIRTLLHELDSQDDQSLSIKFGCAVLLEQSNDARHMLDLMSADQRKFILTTPISSLLRK